jgi:hypothetical protein
MLRQPFFCSMWTARRAVPFGRSLQQFETINSVNCCPPSAVPIRDKPINTLLTIKKTPRDDYATSAVLTHGAWEEGVR